MRNVGFEEVTAQKMAKSESWKFGFFLAVMGLLGIALCALFFAIGYTQAFLEHQCPDGNQCEDAMDIMKIMAVGMIPCLVLTLGGLHHIRKHRARR